MTNFEFTVLKKIDTETGSPIVVSYLAQELNFSRQWTSTAINSLIRQGLIRREGLFRFFVTDAGRELLEEHNG